MSDYHESVLLHEAIGELHVEPGGKYIDATLGGGGHTLEIVKRGGIVLGIDADEDAIEHVEKRFKIQDLGFKIGEQLRLVRGNFVKIGEIARANGFSHIDGILLDLGVSSYQLDTGDRGFSFQKDAPLDMRMDISLGVKAQDLINGLTKGELYELLDKYGEEEFARPIVRSIVSARDIKPIQTTRELAEIIIKGYPIKHKKIHPATKTFQALRIAVNDELNSLRDALPQALELIKSKGRLVIITFHSLEDRIVKKEFLDFESHNLGRVIYKKPIEPTEEEKVLNKRSRSAKMRVFEKN